MAGIDIRGAGTIKAAGFEQIGLIARQKTLA